MARFPTYESSQNINTAPAGVERHQAAQPFEDLQNIIQTTSKITQGLSDANDVMQETKQKTYYETAFAQQELAAQQDPNPDNVEMHLKAIQAIQKNAPKIDNQEVAGNATLQMQHTAFLTEIKIQDLFKSKQQFANDTRLHQLATTTAFNVANPVTAAAAQEDENKFLQTLNDNASRGLITPGRAIELQHEYKIGVVKNKISSNDSMNIEDYKGLTDGLDLKESNEADKMIQAHIKQVKESDITNTLDNRIKILGGVATKQLDWKSADKITAIASKDPALGSALQMVFDAQVNNKTDYEPTSKEGQEYADSVTKLMKGMTKEQVSEYLLKAIEQISKLPAGEMQDRLAVLVNASEDRAKFLPIRDEQEIPPSVIQQEGGIQAILRWNKQHGNNDPQTLNDYLKGIHNGQTSSESYNNAIKSKIIKDHPEVAAQKDVPNRIIDNDTKSFHIFSGKTIIYPARIWNEKLGRFEINPNREQNNDNSPK